MSEDLQARCQPRSTCDNVVLLMTLRALREARLYRSEDPYWHEVMAEIMLLAKEARDDFLILPSQTPRQARRIPDRLLELALFNATVHQAIDTYRCGSMSWEEVLESLVVVLADANTRLLGLKDKEAMLASPKAYVLRSRDPRYRTSDRLQALNDNGNPDQVQDVVSDDNGPRS